MLLANILSLNLSVLHDHAVKRLAIYILYKDNLFSFNTNCVFYIYVHLSSDDFICKSLGLLVFHYRPREEFNGFFYGHCGMEKRVGLQMNKNGLYGK